MKTRAITGFFFVLVMLASVLFGPITFTLFFLILSLLCLNEFYPLIKQEDVKPRRVAGTLLGFAGFAILGLYYTNDISITYLLLIVPFVSAIFIAQLYSKSPSPFNDIAYTFLGVVYVVIPFCFFYALGFLDGLYNFRYPLGFMLLLWASDTGAYLVGMNLGKNKLFERHSPKKSWEGFLGGMLFGLIVAFILSNYWNELSLLHWTLVSLIIACFGAYGDLIESMLKRSVNTKDSGSLLPGHGGLLDRFDGLLLSAPIVFVYLYCTKILLN
jgi:phosphatidate cytidylyltransferase